MPPFLSILIGTFIAGLGAGLPAEAVAKAFSKGAGSILGEAGIIIALGSMLGALMAESGAADRIASTLLGLGKGRSLPWVMALVAMVIGLPLFFEVGLVLLMLGSTFAKVALDPRGGLAEGLKFLGEPLVALGLAVLAATVLLGWGSGMPRERVGGVLRKSLAPIAALLLTIGVGGGLKQPLLDAGVSHTVAKVAEGAHLPYILLAWLIAVALRQATGSATVATTTTAGILASVVAGLAGPQASLIALAIGAGSVFFCHVNDAGFWMVREYFGLELKQTLWVWSVLQTLVSLTGLAGTLLLSLWL